MEKPETARQESIVKRSVLFLNASLYVLANKIDILKLNLKAGANFSGGLAFMLCFYLSALLATNRWIHPVSDAVILTIMALAIVIHILIEYLFVDDLEEIRNNYRNYYSPAYFYVYCVITLLSPIYVFAFLLYKR